MVCIQTVFTPESENANAALLEQFQVWAESGGIAQFFKLHECQPELPPLQISAPWIGDIFSSAHGHTNPRWYFLNGPERRQLREELNRTGSTDKQTCAGGGGFEGYSNLCLCFWARRGKIWIISHRKLSPWCFLMFWIHRVKLEHWGQYIQLIRLQQRSPKTYFSLVYRTQSLLKNQ